MKHVKTDRQGVHWVRLAACALIFLSPCLAFSQRLVILNDLRQQYDLGPLLEILVDPGGRLTIEDVLQPEIAAMFLPSSRRTPNFGFTQSAYWVRFRVRNEASTRSPWALQLNYPSMDFIDLHILTAAGESLTVRKAGRMRPIEAREQSDPLPVFLIPFPKSQIQTIYMRFQCDESMTIPLVIRSMTGYVSQVGLSNVANGIFMGILLIMILYNLFLFIFLRDKNYLYFVLCIASILFFTISFRGIGYFYLWPHSIGFNKLALLISAGLLVMALLKFSDTFMMGKTHWPRLHRAFVGLMLGTGLLLVGAPFLGYRIIIQPMVLAGMLGSVLMVAAAILSFLKGYRPARFLLLGFSINSLGGVIFLSVRMGWLPSTHLSEQGFATGNILIILLMALALADRIKILRIEKEKSERNLRESEERVRILSRATEQSPALVIITDLQGNIEYVNPRFTEVTGYSLAEVIGRNPRLLKSGSTPAEVHGQIWRAISSGDSWRGELRNRKKDGTMYWENALICPIKNERGESTHYLGLKEDITEHKELQEQLFQIQKMESIGTLAGGIAHDFNNILTVIRGHADMALAKLEESQPVAKNVFAIRSAGERAENLIRQILAFSRKQIYLPQVVSINQVIMDMKSMLIRLIGEDIQIVMALEKQIPAINADPSQIERIFVNLIVNARDAINQKTEKASEKKITVETGVSLLDDNYVRMHVGSRKGPHVFFSVSDNGIGISAENRKKIFEPFFSTKKTGTGLGLATVYGIVKQNDANIFLYSEPGKGTTFKIYWPATTEELPLRRPEPVLSKESGGQGKILLAEDDPAVADLAFRVLQEAGYQVLVAKDGTTALDLVTREGFVADLLVTDLIMPGMNGNELAEKVKRLLPGVRVLFSSGYTDNHLVHNGQLDAAIEFLQKPYSAENLLKKVREVLQK